MPFAIVSLVIILVALVVAAFVIIRKFPKLAALDVEELPEKKHKKKKKEILDRRATEKVGAFVTKLKERAKELPLKEIGGKIAKHTRRGTSFVEAQYSRLAEEKQQKKAKRMDEDELSETIDARLRKAEQLAEEERYEDAEAAFIDVIRMENKHAGAYRGLGKTYLKNGQHEEAEATFNFLLKLTPDDDTVYVKLAQNASAAGDRLKAIDYYEKGLKMNPGMPRRFFEVADLYQEEGEEDKAREAYERAVELEPGNPRYIDGLLDMLIMMGKVKEAKENLRELKKANPDNNKIEEFEKRIKDMK